MKPTISILGQTAGRSPHHVFGIHQSDRLFHAYIVGQTGTGKSTLLLQLLKRDLEAGRGFCLIDPHGDLAESVRSYIIERSNAVDCGKTNKIGPDTENTPIIWDVADPNCSVGYNPLTYVAAEYRPLVASGIIDTFKQQWADAWGVRMEHMLRFALLTLLERPGSTLADIVPMFTQKTFRSSVIVHVTDEAVLSFWRDEYPNMNYKNAFDGVAPIANKLGAFLANPLVRRAICNPEQPLRFRQLMDQGTPLIVNLAKGRLGSDVTNVLGGLITSMMAHAAYSRANIPEQRRRPYYLYADEFHAFTTEAFAGMLSELRKYKLGLVLAHQHTSQLKKSVLEAIFGNVGTLCVFRVGASDAGLLSRQLDVSDPHKLIDQPNYRVHVRLMIQGNQSKEFTAKTIG